MADEHDVIAKEGLAAIGSMIETAMAIQKHLGELAVWRVDFFLPAVEKVEEECEPAEPGSATDSVVDNSVSIGPVNVYSMAESLNETLSDFLTQTFSVASVYTQYASPAVAGIPPQPGLTKDIGSSRESTSRSVNAGQGRESSEAVSRVSKSLETSSSAMEGLRRSVEESESSEAISRVSESLKASSSAIEGLRSAVESVSDVSKDESGVAITERYRETLRSGIEKALEERPTARVDRQAIDVPAFSPTRAPAAATVNTSVSSSSLNIRHDASVGEQAATMDSSYSSALSSVYEAIAGYGSVSFASDIFAPVFGAGPVSMNSDVSSTASLSKAMSVMLKSAALAPASLTQAVYESYNSQALSAVTNAYLNASNEGDRFTLPMMQGPSFSTVSRTMESLRPVVATSRVDGQKSATSTFNNTFNITVNVKGKEDEAEMRELGRKIGLILTEELKRYGGTS